jgi:serine/threonine-protein kinase RsbW
MTFAASDKILGRRRTGKFVGRPEHLERLLSVAEGRTPSNGLALLAAPGSGASELLRHTYDRLFISQEAVAPFYFELKPTDRTAQAASLRFLCEFLIQTGAFKRRDPAIISASPALAEIADLAAPADGNWIGPLVDNYHHGGASGERAFSRNCLGAPVRAGANGTRVFVMIDAAHLAQFMDDGDAWVDDACELLSRSDIPFVIAGLRRALFARTPLETLALEPFGFDEAGKFIEELASSLHVAVNDQTRDLIAVQLDGNARHITSLVTAAAASGREMLNFERVEQVYTDEIFGGRIGRSLDEVIKRASGNETDERRIIGLLSELRASPEQRIATERSINAPEFVNGARVLRTLNEYEIAGVGAGVLQLDETNFVVGDYIDARLRLDARGEQRALAVGEAMTANVKRAPSLMARHYRRSSALGIRQILDSFDGRGVPPGLIDYSTFKAELKGLSDDRILEEMSRDDEAITLPRIVYTADTTSFYPPLRELLGAERSAIALGFTGEGEGTEAAWIAAEIDSKLEAGPDVAEFWCDRLEMAAVHCDISSYRLWLVAPEGFNETAIKVLDDRNAFGSSRRQAEILRRVLSPSTGKVQGAAKEYEFTVPMGDDTELIAAHAVEEIAKRCGFSPKAINQIKTAVVEACINAVEHSLSPDRRIYQKFAVDADKLTITIANRGLRLTDKKLEQENTGDGRRGWGLKLMKGLMDEVAIERTDDGTRITMIKYRTRPTDEDQPPSLSL